MYLKTFLFYLLIQISISSFSQDLLNNSRQFTVGDNLSLKANNLDSCFKINAQFDRDNHIFLNEEKVRFSLSLNNSSEYKLAGKLNYILISDFKDTLSSWNEEFNIQPEEDKTILINKGSFAPGFYSLHIKFDNQFIDNLYSIDFGVNPEKIASPTDKTSDFDNFWQRAKHELAAVDPQYKLIKKDSLSSQTKDVYLVEMRSLDNLLIRGWYACPKAPGKYPAILHLQGLSVNAQIGLNPAEEDMAVLVLNIRGHGNSCDEINPGFPGFLTHNLKDKERYIYRGAFMDCLRAVDFLVSRNEVDSSLIIVQGGSQGGALSFATAALDNQRVALCIPNIPFLSDFPDYFKLVSWPTNEFADFEKVNQSFGWEGIFNTLSYFDIKNLAGLISCPVFMAIGLKDGTCPPHINFAAYNQLNVSKKYLVFPEAGHFVPDEYYPMIYDWIKSEIVKTK